MYVHTFCCRSWLALLLSGLPFSLTSFNDDTDPAPGVRVGRVTVVLGGGFVTPGLEIEGVLLAASEIEARGRWGGFTVSGSGEETIEALDGGLAIAEAGGLETDDERIVLVPTEDDNGFLSAEGWNLAGTREVLRVWAGTGGFGGGIAVFVAAGVFLTGEAVGESLTPGAVTLGKTGLPALTT